MFFRRANMAHYLYDLAIIGGGSGGLTAARIATSLGANVLLIDKERLLALFANGGRQNRVNKCNIHASSHVATACAVTSCCACCSAQTMPLVDVLLSACSAGHTELPLSLPSRCSSITVLLECRHPLGRSVCGGTFEARISEETGGL